MSDSDEAQEPEGRPKAARRIKVPRIPGYHIQSVIGRGSTGTVYRARQENVDREIALKVMHKELASRPRMVQRLQREARTTARLGHPHIVSAIDMGRTGELWWFAMELVDGPSLALKLRQEGRLSEREALRLFIPLCEALVHIWENGVVHRDIKPANILIDKVSGARLADLGLAFAGNDPHLTGSEGTLGTPHYISPEQAREPSSVDIRTDIWSFGATLFHAVCGEPPLRGANVAEVLSGVLYGRIPDPLDLEPDLSRGFSLVLRKCLSRDFEKRYQTPRELLRDLERVRERRKPRVRVASLEPVAGSNHRMVRSLFAAGLIGVVGVGALLLWQRPWEASESYEPYAPLAALVEKLDRRQAPPGVVLAQLEELRAELPAQDLGVWRDTFNAARAERDRELELIVESTTERFEAALLEEEFGRAEDVLGVDVDEALAKRAGLTLDQAPPEFRFEVTRLEGRLGRAVASAETDLRKALVAAFEARFLTELEERIAAGRWRAAAEYVDVTARDLVGVLDIELDGLPAARQSALRQVLSGRIEQARKDLERRWAMLDADLVRWVDTAARELADELSAELEPIAAGARLREGFAAELERRGVAREELLNEPEGLAKRRLAEEAAALEELEQLMVGQRETGDLDVLESLAAWLDGSVARGAYAERRYEDARAYWQGRRRWLDENPLKMAPWWKELELHVDARLAEAEVLRALRDGAAAALAELEGDSIELHMTPEVRAEGELAVQGSGAATSAVFSVGGGAEYELFLAAPAAGLPPGARMLQAADVLGLGLERLAPGSRQAARALFLFREGDLESAREALAAVAAEGPLGRVAAEHLRGLERQRSVASELEVRRREQAAGLLASLYLDAPDRMARLERDPTRALARIGRLLSEFGDLEVVAARASELKALERDLRSPRAGTRLEDFEAVFGDGNVALGDEEVRLEVRFDGLTAVGIERGDWTPDGVGWLSPGDLASDDDMFARDNPRWVLRPPFDADSGPVAVEFVFVEPQNTGAERVVVATALGYDVVVRTDSNAEVSWVGVGARGAERLLVDVRDGTGERFERALLEPGERHELEMVVDKRRGRLRVILDGQELVDRALTSPLGRTGSYGVTLAAREQVRLLALRARAALGR